MGSRARQWRDARPVFVVGVPRSGTTLLYRMLLSHPSFAHERANFSESRAVAAMRDFDGRGPANGTLTAFLLGDDVPPDVRSVAARSRNRRRVVRKLGGAAAMRPGLWALGGEHHPLRAYFAAAADVRKGQRIVEKTPEHLAYVRHLRRAFPQARFVCIHRHPVDVLGSHWERFAREGERAAWAAVSVDKIADQWRTAVEDADRLQQASPESFTVIRYEDFVGDTDRVAAEILRFLDEPFDPACLLRQGLSGDYPSDPRILEPISPSEEPWQERVGVADAARLERMLAVPMSHLRYRPRANDELCTWDVANGAAAYLDAAYRVLPGRRSYAS